MDSLCDSVVTLKETIPKISVDEVLAALALTGNNSADLIRIVNVAADIVGKLGRNISAQWVALELIAARIDEISAD